MNHIFRVIWNEALHLWQCVNELTQSHAKATQSNRERRRVQLRNMPATDGLEPVNKVAFPLILTPLTSALLSASLLLGTPAQAAVTQYRGSWLPSELGLVQARPSNTIAAPAQILMDGNSHVWSQNFDQDLPLDSTNLLFPELNRYNRLIISRGSALELRDTTLSLIQARDTNGRLQGSDEVGGLIVGTSAFGSLYPLGGGPAVNYIGSGSLILSGNTRVALEKYPLVSADGNINIGFGAEGSLTLRDTASLTGSILSIGNYNAGGSSYAASLTIQDNASVDVIGLKMSRGVERVAPSMSTFTMTGGTLAVTGERGLVKGQISSATTAAMHTAVVNLSNAKIQLRQSGDAGGSSSKYAGHIVFGNFGTNSADRIVLSDVVTIDAQGAISDTATTSSSSAYHPWIQESRAGFQGSGTFVKEGTGTFVFVNENNQYQGNILVQGGNLEVGGYGLLWDGTRQITGYTTLISTISQVGANDANQHTAAVFGTLSTREPDTGWGSINSGLGSGSVQLDAGTNLTISRLNTNTWTLANAVSGEGNLRVVSRVNSPTEYSTTVLDHNHDYIYTGDTLVYSGALQLDGAQVLHTRQVDVSPRYTTSMARLALVNGATLQSKGAITLGDVSDSQYASEGNASLSVNDSTIEASNVLASADHLYGVTIESQRGTWHFTETGTFFSSVGDIVNQESSVGNDQIVFQGDNTFVVDRNVESTQYQKAAFTTNSSGTFSKQGEGTLSLTAANTQTQNWALEQGRLVLKTGETNASLGGTQVNLMAGTTLEVSTPNTWRFSTLYRSLSPVASGANLNVMGAGTLEKTAAGTAILDARLNGFTGQTSILGGQLRVDVANAWDANAGLVYTGEGANKGDLVFNQSTESRFSNGIQGAGGVIHTGAGKTILMNSANGYTYTGQTDIQNGELVISSGVNIEQTASIDVHALSPSNRAALTIQGSAHVIGNVEIAHDANAGSQNVLTIDGAVLESQHLKRWQGSALASVNLKNAGLLQLTSSGTFLENFDTTAGDTIQLGMGGGVVEVASGQTQTQGVKAAISDEQGATGLKGLTKKGEGTLVLTAKNTFTGDVYLNEGRLELGNGASSALTQLNKSTEGHGNVIGATTQETHFAINFNDDVTFDRVVSGNVVFEQLGAGKTILNKDQTYTGNTLIRQGTLAFDNITLASSEVDTGSDSTHKGLLEIVWDGQTAQTIDYNITGVGSVQKSGSGEIVYDGSEYTYSGATYITGGTLRVKGNESQTTEGSSEINITATDGANEAKVIIESDAFAHGKTVIGDVSVLGKDYTHDALNSLEIRGVTYATTQLERGDGDDSVAEIVLNSLSEEQRATLKITETGTLFDGFDTDWSEQAGHEGESDDIVRLDGLGGNIEVASGVTATQYLHTSISGGTDGASLNKTGEGTLVLTAHNTFAGKVNVEAGTLVLGDGATPTQTDRNVEVETTLGGSGKVNISQGATFATNFANDVTTGAGFTFDRGTEGGGVFRQMGEGTTTVTKALEHTGGTFVDAGTLKFTDEGGVNADSTVTLASGATLEIGYTDGQTHALNYSVVGAGGNFIKTGNSTLTIDAAGTENVFTWTGDSIVKGGVVDVKSYSEHQTVTGQHTIQVSAEDADLEARLRVSGTLGAQRTLLAEGAKEGSTSTLEIYGVEFKTTNLQRSSTSTNASAQVLIDSPDAQHIGTLAIELAQGSSSGSLLDSFDTSRASNADRIALGQYGGAIKIADGNTITQGEKAAISGGSAGAHFIKSGAGELVLTAKNTFLGDVQVDAGVLRLGNGSAREQDGDVKTSLSGNTNTNVNLAEGATFAVDFSDDLTLSAIVGTGQIAGVNQATATHFVKAGDGDMTIDTNVLDTQYVAVNDGRLIVKGDADLVWSGAVTPSETTTAEDLTNVQVADGAILEVGYESGNYNLVYNLTGAGSFEKTGESTVHLVGGYTYTLGGTVTVKNGEIVVEEAATPGSAGAIRVGGEANKTAMLTLQGHAQPGAQTILAYEAGANSTSILNIHGSVYETGDLTRQRQAGVSNVAKVIIDSYTDQQTVRHEGTLLVTGNSATGELFEGFDTAQGDVIEFGSGGATIKVQATSTEGTTPSPITVTQSNKAAFSGTGGFTKTGNGTLVLTANNTFTGNVTLSEGGIMLGDGNARVVTGEVVTALSGNANQELTLAEGTSFGVNFSDNATFGDIVGDQGFVKGAGTFIKKGDGTLTLEHESQLDTQAVNIEGGTLAVTGDVDLRYSEAVDSDPQAANYAPTTVTIGAGATFEMAYNDGATHRVDYNVSGTGNFVKRGNSTIVFDGLENGYKYDWTGNSTIKGGVVEVKSYSSQQTTGQHGVVVSAEDEDLEAVLKVTGNLATTNTQLVDEASAAGSYSVLEISGVTYSTKNLIRGTNTDAHAKVSISSNDGHMGVLKFDETGTMLEQLQEGDAVTIDDVLGGAIEVTSGKTVTQGTQAPISGGGAGTHFVKKGGGELVLTAQNTFDSDVKVDGGTLTVGNGDAIGTTQLSGRTNTNVELAENTSFGVNTSSDIDLTSVLGSSGKVGNASAVTSTFVKAGSGVLTVSEDNIDTQNTHIKAGTLRVEGNANMAWSNTTTMADGVRNTTNATVTVDQGATYELHVNDGDALDGDVVNYNILGDGNFVKTGTGTIVFDGAQKDYSYGWKGDSTIKAGTVIVKSYSAYQPTGTTGNKTIYVSSDTANQEAKLVVAGPFGSSQTVLAKDAASGSTSTLEIRGVTFATGSFERDDTHYDAHAKVVLESEDASHLGTLLISQSGNLLEAFDTTRGDSIAIGESVGGAISVASGAEVVQGSKAALSGGGATATFYKAGAGTLFLTAQNTFTGNVQVTGGKLYLGHGDNHGTTQLGANPKTVTIETGTTYGIDFTDTYTLTDTVTGAGNFEQKGTGTTIITSEQTYQGSTLITQGTLQVGDGQATGTLGGTGDITDNGTLAFNHSSSDTLNRALIGTGNLHQMGSGTLTLDRRSSDEDTEDYQFTYSGKTQVSAGTMMLASHNHITSTTGVEVGAAQQDGSATFVIQGTATVAGEVLLGKDAASNTQSDLMVDGATLSAQSIKRGEAQTDSTDVQIALTLKNNATLKVARSEESTATNANHDQVALFEGFDTTRAAADTIQFGASASDITTVEVDTNIDAIQDQKASMTGSGTLKKTGAGTFVMNADNSGFTGTLSIEAGRVQLGNGQTLNDDAANQLLAGTGPISVAQNASLAVNLADGVTFHLDRDLTGAGTFVQAGANTTEVTSALGITGGAFIEGGRLRLVDSANEFTGDSAVVNLGTSAEKKGVLEVNVSGGEDVNMAFSLEGKGDFEKTGAGTAHLVEGKTYTLEGTVKILNGELEVDPGAIPQSAGSILIGANQANTTATLTLTGAANPGAKTVLAYGAADNSTSILHINGSVYNTTDVTRDLSAGDTAHAKILIEKSGENEGVLLITESTTNESLLFHGFDTTQPAQGNSRDTIEFGETGAVIRTQSTQAEADPIVVKQDARAGFSGTGGFTKEGNGTLILTAHNTFTGDLSVNEGTLQVGDGGAIGTTTLSGSEDADLNIAEGANVAVNFAQDEVYTVTRSLSGKGNFVQEGANTTIINRKQHYTGQTLLHDGEVKLTIANALEDGSTVVLGDTTGSGTLNVAYDNDPNMSDNDKVIKFNISGSGNFVKSGSGKAILAASYTDAQGQEQALSYSVDGDVAVKGGTLEVGLGARPQSARRILIGAEKTNGEAILQLTGDAAPGGETIVGYEAQQGSTNRIWVNGSQYTTGDLKRDANTVKTSSAQLLIESYTDANNVFHQGRVVLTQTGTLFEGFNTAKTGDAADYQDQIRLGTGGGAFDLRGDIVVTQARTGAISGTDTSSNFTKLGAGTLRLTAENTYSGQVSIEEGTVELGDGGTVTQEGVTTALGGDLTKNIEVKSGAQLAVNFRDTYVLGDNGTTVASRVLTGAGDLVQRGTGRTEVNRVHTYTGSTSIEAGRLVLVDNGDLSATSVVNTGTQSQSGTFAIEKTGNYEFTRRLSGNGVFEQAGTGTTTVTQDQSEYLGTTRVSQGTLALGESIRYASEQIQINALSHNTQSTNGDAIFKIGKGARVGVVDGIVLASSDAADGTTSTLWVEGATLETSSITRGDKAAPAALAKVILSGEATLLLSNNAQSGELASYLFRGFDTTQGDQIALGTGGAVLNFEGNYVQSKTAAISSLDGAQNTNLVLSGGEGDTFVIRAQNTYRGQLSVDNITLMLGYELPTQSDTAQTVSLGGEGDIVLNGTTSNLAINLKGDYRLGSDNVAQGQPSRKLTGEGGLYLYSHDGTTIVDRVHDYQGQTQVAAGATLKLIEGGDLTQTASIDLLEASSKLEVVRQSDYTLSRSITGEGSVRIDSDGVIELSNTQNSFTGEVVVKHGTLRVSDFQTLGALDKTVHFGDYTLPAYVVPTTTTSSASLRRARMLRAVSMDASLTETSAVESSTLNTATPTLALHFNEDTVARVGTDGQGDVQKTGSGVLTLDSTTPEWSHTGQTVIQAGALRLAQGKGISQSALRVASSAQLSASDGEHVLGALTLEAGSHTVVHLTDPSTYTQYVVNGVVSIENGARLDIDVAGTVTNATFEGTDRIVGVLRGESVLGEFGANYSDNSAIFTFRPVSTANTVDLIVAKDHSSAGTCQTGHELECLVVAAGDTKASGMAAVLDTLFNEAPASSFASLFYKIDTNEKAETVVVESLPLLTGSGNRLVADDARRLAALPSAIDCHRTENGVSLWGQMTQGWSDQDADQGATGYHAKHGALALGSDVCLRDSSTRLGAMLGYVNSRDASRDSKLDHRLDSDMIQVGLYGEHDLNEAVYVDFDMGYANAHLTGERYLHYFGKRADSDYHSDVFYAGVGLNTRLGMFSPFMRFDLMHVKSHAYGETGADALNFNVESQSTNSARLSLGVAINHTWDRASLKAKVGGSAELADATETIRAAFQAAPQRTFDTSSAEKRRLQGFGELQFTYQTTPSSDLSLTYRVQGNGEYVDQSGTANFTWHF